MTTDQQGPDTRDVWVRMDVTRMTSRLVLVLRLQKTQAVKLLLAQKHEKGQNAQHWRLGKCSAFALMGLRTRTVQRRIHPVNHCLATMMGSALRTAVLATNVLWPLKESSVRLWSFIQVLVIKFPRSFQLKSQLTQLLQIKCFQKLDSLTRITTQVWIVLANLVKTNETCLENQDRRPLSVIMNQVLMVQIVNSI